MGNFTNFREELLKVASNNYPKIIQDLLDSGIIQECQVIDEIYYISFGYHLICPIFYNYEDNSHYFDFIYEEVKDEVIYAGGMAVNNDGIILEGIIYPFYINSLNLNNIGKEKIMPYTYGTPQIINKSYKLNISDFFAPGFCRVFNLTTDSSNAWAEFILGVENYKNTFIPCDSEGKQTIYPNDNNEVTYFGKLEEGYKKNHGVKRYGGVLINTKNSVSIEFIEKYLNHKKLQSSIATKIYCTEETNKTSIKVAEINQNGMNNIADAITKTGTNIITGAKINQKGMNNIANAVTSAGINVRKGVSNIADAINRPPKVM